jgi:hypothetical protein
MPIDNPVLLAFATILLANSVSSIVIAQVVVGIEVQNSQMPVLLLNMAFGLFLNTALYFLLGVYSFFVNFYTCLLFCNAVGDPLWKFIWISAVSAISLLSSLSFQAQSKLISGIIFRRTRPNIWAGAWVFSLTNALTWLIVAEFKLLHVFKSYHGAA